MEEERYNHVVAVLSLCELEGTFYGCRLAAPSLALDPEKTMVRAELGRVPPIFVLWRIENLLTCLFDRWVDACDARVHVVEFQSFHEVEWLTFGIGSIVDVLILDVRVSILHSCIVSRNTFSPVSSWVMPMLRHFDIPAPIGFP